jgi:hypothetical protein
MAQQISNPYADDDQVQIEPVRDTQKITPGQMMYLMARKFPRSKKEAVDRITLECCQKQVAEEAFYSFTRGRELVEGPSIRLAEVMARNWGNMDYGVEEIDRNETESTLRAYCIDLESNTMSSKVFVVPHSRDTRQGKKKLASDRDIYEHVANNGARRMRACILALIPKDVVEIAAHQVNTTLASDMGTPEEEIKRLIEAFGGFGVSPDRIAERLGHPLTSVTPSEIVVLRKVYASIRENFSSAEIEFPVKKATLVDQMTGAINNAKPKEAQRV